MINLKKSLVFYAILEKLQIKILFFNPATVKMQQTFIILNAFKCGFRKKAKKKQNIFTITKTKLWVKF